MCKRLRSLISRIWKMWILKVGSSRLYSFEDARRGNYFEGKPAGRSETEERVRMVRQQIRMRL